MFHKFKIWFINKKIVKIPKRQNNKFHYLNTGKNIGVIIESNNIELVKRVEDFLFYLKEKRINIEEINIINRKITKNDNFSPKTISIYGLKWINSPVLKEFCNKQFDLLFVFYFKEQPEINYICALSNADLKVSPHYNNFNSADLTFMLKDNSDPQEFFNAIKTYLIDYNIEKEAI